MNKKLIIFYGTDWCQDCVRAKKVFDDIDVPYKYVSIDMVKGTSEKVMEINNGNRSIPTIIFPDGSSMTEPGSEELERKILGLSQSRLN